MKILSYRDKKPRIDDSAFIAEGAIIIGDVTIAAESSVWFNSVIRGDVARIEIGRATNIQDGTIIHVSRNDGPTLIGNRVTIGHRAVIHACTIYDEAFIGMSATILDKAIIEPQGFIAAGALLSPGKIVKSRELWAGVPAKFIRHLNQDEIDYLAKSSDNYVKLALDYASFI
ncbi:MAG: caiE [Rickettsiaceae bacterium]|jgi:carbonic anhydrase/acetyltransferase-like protein (isoleucine patch superfamily)|nr:caiE [Rickettsiaceae bacterium]